MNFGSLWMNPNPRTYLGAPVAKLTRSYDCAVGNADHGCSAAFAIDSDGAWWVVIALPCNRHHREWERLREAGE